MSLKTFLLWCVFCVGLPHLLYAQCPGQTTALEPLAEEKLTVDSTPRGLTQASYQGASGVATMAAIQVQNGPVVYRAIGTPSPTQGTVVTAWSNFAICGIASIRAFRVVRYDNDAALFVTYYKSR